MTRAAVKRSDDVLAGNAVCAQAVNLLISRYPLGQCCIEAAARGKSKALTKHFEVHVIMARLQRRARRHFELREPSTPLTSKSCSIIPLPCSSTSAGGKQT